MTKTYEGSRTYGAQRAGYSSESDKRDQIHTLTRLFVLFPKPNDPELTMAAYLDALSDLPPMWLRRALYVLVMEDSTRKWLPSISEIRGAAAEEIRGQWYKHNRPEGVVSGHGQRQIDIRHWLAVCKGRVPPERAFLSVVEPERIANAEQELGF